MITRRWLKTRETGIAIDAAKRTDSDRAGDTSPWARGDAIEIPRNPRNRDRAVWGQSSYRSLPTISLKSRTEKLGLIGFAPL